MTIKLYEKIKNATCAIFKEDTSGTKIHCGTGTIISLENTKFILTARHVISENQINEMDFDGFYFKLYSEIQINIADNSSRNETFHKLSINGKELAGNLNIGNDVTYPIDLALLQFPNDMNFNYDLPELKFENQELTHGLDVYCAGYSCETIIPFFKDCFKGNLLKFQEFSQQSEYNPFLTIKNGKISGLISFSNEKLGYILSFIYIDNGMFKGASGGGIFNQHGDIIGVIIQARELNRDVEIDVKQIKIDKLDGWILDDEGDKQINIDLGGQKLIKKIIAKIPVSTGSTIGIDLKLIQHYIDIEKSWIKTQ